MHRLATFVVVSFLLAACSGSGAYRSCPCGSATMPAATQPTPTAPTVAEFTYLRPKGWAELRVDLKADGTEVLLVHINPDAGMSLMSYHVSKRLRNATPTEIVEHMRMRGGMFADGTVISSGKVETRNDGSAVVSWRSPADKSTSRVMVVRTCSTDPGRIYVCVASWPAWVRDDALLPDLESVCASMNMK